MHILITGGTGLIGSALIKRLQQKGYTISVLTRNLAQGQSKLPKTIRFLTALAALNNLDEFDAVINLAGEPIFHKRWSSTQKQRLLSSRVTLTQMLTRLINQSIFPPIFISASAMGIYGDRGNQEITELTSIENHPPSFTTMLCQQWEHAALQANTRVCLLRTGMVFSLQGGALSQVLPLYRCGLGGKLGNGKQSWAWIALEDMVNGIIFLLENPQCSGGFNFVAPTPITNAEFNRLLAKTLHRPACCHVPFFILKGLLGERAHILLDSQKAIPQALLNKGFVFQYQSLSDYLVNLNHIKSQF